MPDNFAKAGNKPRLRILDDLLNKAYSKEVCHLFTKGSHHHNISMILITQNLFHQAKHCRDISLNAKYIVLLKNTRDTNQFTHLARQVYPEDGAGLYKAYLEASDKPHGYFVLDFSQDTDDRLRFEPTYFRTRCHLHSIRHRLMRHMKDNYHTLQVPRNVILFWRSNQENEMCGPCSTYGGVNVHRGLMGNPVVGDHCEDKGIDGRIILKWNFNMP